MAGSRHTETQLQNVFPFLVTMLQLGLVSFHRGPAVVRICSCGEMAAPNVALQQNKRQQHIHRLCPAFKNTAEMTLMMANTTWTGTIGQVEQVVGHGDRLLLFLELLLWWWCWCRCWWWLGSLDAFTFQSKEIPNHQHHHPNP